ncbi:glycosyltransferase family 4 protein [Actinoplanes sp. NPDC051513]|uniref:glycosyltransferase family 4 protein n=1 Tax=Actinoplanes sp. NPDC051513 TaxID=3363908 RepID=UPI0037998CFC
MQRFTLWAQRRAHSVPAPLRRLGGRVLARLDAADRDAPAGPPEDWTVPLVAGRPGGDLLSLRPAPVRAAPPATAAVTGEPLRAVIAIDVLDVGGMDEFVAFLGRRLPRFGVQTVVAYAGTRMAGYQGEAGRLVAQLESEGVATLALDEQTCRDQLRAFDPAVISAHGAPEWLPAAAADLGVPYVETLHGMHHFLHPEVWPGERERARQISAQIAVSELVRRQYLAGNPDFPADRLVTIPNGVDPERVRLVDRASAREALGLRDEFLFLSLARYGLQKNTYALLTAFAEVAAAHPDAHLLVAGRADDARYYAQVRAYADQLAVADRIHLRGHCPNPAALLSAADGFVLDSFFEGWSLASMEALTSGVPTVMTDVGGAREQLAAGDRGILVEHPAGDPTALDWGTISDLRFRPQQNEAELVAAMAKLIGDRAHWAERRSALRAETLAEFSAEQCLRRHADVLKAVAAGHTPTVD